MIFSASGINKDVELRTAQPGILLYRIHILEKLIQHPPLDQPFVADPKHEAAAFAVCQFSDLVPADPRISGSLIDRQVALQPERNLKSASRFPSPGQNSLVVLHAAHLPHGASMLHAISYPR